MSAAAEHMNRATVLLAEDHTETAERLRKLLRAEFDVVAWVLNGVDLVEAVGAPRARCHRRGHRDAWP